MSYQVLARKYRPQRFDEVVGQQGVTQTLRNAIAGGRLAQSYIFAGPRGVGKTTTARILAKALNCVGGPTVDPCGRCDACIEIAEGRDIDVLEIDAATHTGVDNVREVIIAGLGIRPVRDRYKIFIIDEVHQLSGSSFNALLKSVEEPPPHIVFMMATTELHKIPDTIRSRSQEFELRTISTRAIVEQLRRIAEAEGLDVEPGALALVARAAEGSLRDAESSLDQVISFAGGAITAGDVTTVLGLVGRDLLLDIVETVASEDAARVFDLAAHAVESGQDLRLLCRELSRVVRDMMLLNIDPSRATDPDFAPEGDIARLKTLAAGFSREDLLRAFDVLGRAEFEIRNSAQPRYHLEMALLKWIHLRRVQPIAEVLQALGKGGASMPPRTQAPFRPRESAPPSAPTPRPRQGDPPTEAPRKPLAAAPGTGVTREPAAPAAAPPAPPARPSGHAAPFDPDAFVQAFLAQVREKKRLLHGTIVAQTQKVTVEGNTITFVFGAEHRTQRKALEENRGVLEQIAGDVAGRAMSIRTMVAEETPAAATPASLTPEEEAQARLRERALADNAVQAMLDVFPAEIRDIEEIEK